MAKANLKGFETDFVTKVHEFEEEDVG